MKRVQFNLQATIVYDGLEMDKESRKNLFYSNHELKQCRLEAIESAQWIGATDISTRTALERLFLKCCTTNGEPTGRAIRFPISSLANQAQIFRKQAGDILGLEKLIMDKYIQDRRTRHRWLQKSIHNYQKLPVTQVEKERLIRMNCEALSRSHRLFSTLVAQAHAASLASASKD